MLKITVRPFTVAKAEFRTRERGAVFIDSRADLQKLRQTTLVELYNAFTGHDIKNFASREEAERRTLAEVFDYISVTLTKEQVQMAKKTATAAPAATPAPAAAAPAAEAGMTDEQRTAAITKIESDMAEAKTRFNEYIGKKKEELKALKSGKTATAGGEKGPSETIQKVIGLLRRPEGATKQQLMDETGAKGGYVGALLSRILAAKGFKPTSKEIEGSRNKSYHLPPA